MNEYLHSKAVIYMADGTITDVVPKNGTDFKSSEINTIVGGYIELVTLVRLPNIGNGLPRKFLFCNEDGKRLKLPVNKEATRIWKLYFAESHDVIVGDVLICSPRMVK